MTRDNPKTAPENDGLGRRCQSSAVLSHLQRHLQRPIHTRRGPSRAVFGAPWGRKRAFEKPILPTRPLVDLVRAAAAMRAPCVWIRCNLSYGAFADFVRPSNLSRSRIRWPAVGRSLSSVRIDTGFTRSGLCIVDRAGRWMVPVRRRSKLHALKIA